MRVIRLESPGLVGVTPGANYFFNSFGALEQRVYVKTKIHAGRVYSILEVDLLAKTSF